MKIIGKKGEMVRFFRDGKALVGTIVLFDKDMRVVGENIKQGTIFVGIGNKKKPSSSDKGFFSYEKDGEKVISVPTDYISLKSTELKEGVGTTVDFAKYLKSGTKVAVQSKTKGKGFAGVVKRHKFAGGPKTHGQSDKHRSAGSVGQRTTPGRVLKGTRMAGRMGGVTKTFKGVEVLDVKDNMVILKGPLPGRKGILLEIKVDYEN